MVVRSFLFPSDRTLAQTITIVTEGWLCGCSEFTEGCQTSQVRQQGLVSRPFGSVVTTPLLWHLSERSLGLAASELRSLSELRQRGDDG